MLLAELRLETGDAEGALRDCERCLRHEARNRRAMALEAVALARLGHHEASRALIDLDRLVRLRRVDPPPPYPDVAGFDTALAQALAEGAETPGAPAAGPDPRSPRRSDECLRGAGGAPGALAARFAGAAKWYLDHRPRDLRHRFLKWRPRDFHVEGDALHLPGGGRSEPEIRERGWVSGLYAIAPARDASACPVVEVGAPPSRHRGETPFGRREIVLEEGRLVLFPSYLFHSLRAPEGVERWIVVTFDMVPD